LLLLTRELSLMTLR